jgi:hypothetical protein
MRYNLERHFPITDGPALQQTAGTVSQRTGGTVTMTNHSNSPDSIQPNTIEIPLSKGYVAVVDECDADLADMLWHAVESRGHVYGARYVYKSGSKRKRIYMHRLILSRMLDRPLAKGEIPDHINNNGLDNRRENLRLATYRQNCGNSRININNTSGFKGVTWRPNNRKWEASLKTGDGSRYLGLFRTPEEAYAAYLEAAKHHFGEFANDGSGPVQS